MLFDSLCPMHGYSGVSYIAVVPSLCIVARQEVKGHHVGFPANPKIHQAVPLSMLGPFTSSLGREGMA